MTLAVNYLLKQLTRYGRKRDCMGGSLQPDVCHLSWRWVQSMRIANRLVKCLCWWPFGPADLWLLVFFSNFSTPVYIWHIIYGWGLFTLSGTVAGFPLCRQSESLVHSFLYRYLVMSLSVSVFLDLLNAFRRLRIRRLIWSVVIQGLACWYFSGTLWWDVVIDDCCSNLPF